MFECRNCAARDARPLYGDVRDQFHGHDGSFDYVACAGCGLVQIAEVPANLGQYYASYRVHGSDGGFYALLRRMTIGHCYLEIDGAGRSLLDFGCGNGWYLQSMMKRGWKPVGYEPDAAYAAQLSRQLGMPVLSGLDALEARREEFDLVTLNFAFEHLAGPRRTLEALSAVLKPGGQIYVTVPNIESREARLFGSDWFHLDPPRHISFFSKDLLRTVLEETGFSAITIKDLPVPTGLAGSVSYKLWRRFEPITWYSMMLPGMLFSAVVPDGNFAISGRRTR